MAGGGARVSAGEFLPTELAAGRTVAIVAAVGLQARVSMCV